MPGAEDLALECTRLRARVDELERTTRATQRSSDLARALEWAGVGAWHWDARTNQATWNDQNYRVMGYEPGAVPASYDSWLARVHDDDKRRVEAEVARVMREGGRLDVVYRAPLDDGSTRWLNDLGYMRYGPDAEPLGMSGVLIDVTERVVARQQVEELHGLLQAVTDQTPDWIFAKDTAHRFLFVNRAFAAAQGREPAEMTGRLDTDFWPLELCEGDPATSTRGFHDDDREAFAGRVVHNPRDAATVAGGDVRLFDTVKSPLKGQDGHVIGVVAFSRDVTERLQAADTSRALEAQLWQSQKMEAVGTLAGGIAHDFNNILAAVVGYGEQLLDACAVDDPRREAALGVMAAAARATELVKQLLAFSRPAGPTRTTLPLGDTIAGACQLLRATMPAAVDIQVSVPPDEVYVAGDPVQVQQVLVKLATNAAYAMRSRGGVLQLACDTALVEAGHPGLAAGPWARLSVSDTGEGIDPAIIDRIFDPFFTTKAPGVGTGLGLAVVHGIVRSHGGHMHVRSRPGQGTEFTLYLPLARDRDRTPEAPAPPPDVGPGLDRRVLIVDDEPAVAHVVSRMLVRLGYDVRTCTSPESAVAALAEAPGRFDVVMTDLAMPGMSGLDVARQAALLSPSTRVVLFTGNVGQLEGGAPEQYGVAAVLTKPFTSLELGLALTRLFGPS